VARDSFVHRRQRYEILERVRLGRKEYLLVRQLSTGPRRRFQAIDPIAGPSGAMRIVQFLPNTAESWQRIGVLQRLSQRNPELPQIVEFHRQRDEIASVESWIEGHDLRWWIRKMKESPRQRLGAPEAMRLFRQLAHAVRHLHRHCGVIHADIKPANIILSHQSRRLTLIDFGSAWGVERTNRRHPGDGTSEVYSAPELLTAASGVHFRADYFSLAAVCFEVLTLHTPYDGLGGRAGLPEYASQTDSLFVPPSQLSRWQAIDTLLLRALQLDANRRHENGADWLKDWDSTVKQIREPQPTLWTKLVKSFTDWLDRR
jgi:serine/threonine protein kinase